MELTSLHKGRSAAPLKRVIANTSRKMGVSEQTAFLFLSHFCEEIAREVSMDNAVSIPAFGMFAPVNWTPRNGISADVATPRFAPSTVFKNEVASCCTPYPKAEEQFNKYRGNHARRKLTASSVHRAQTRYRAVTVCQAKNRGIDPFDVGS